MVPAGWCPIHSPQAERGREKRKPRTYLNTEIHLVIFEPLGLGQTIKACLGLEAALSSKWGCTQKHGLGAFTSGGEGDGMQCLGWDTAGTGMRGSGLHTGAQQLPFAIQVAQGHVPARGNRHCGTGSVGRRLSAHGMPALCPRHCWAIAHPGTGHGARCRQLCSCVRALWAKCVGEVQEFL